MPKPTPPLVAHVVYRLSIGGLENGLVNLINRIPEDRYRHAVICVTDYSSFSKRIQREDVKIFALHKSTGHDPKLYINLYKLFWRLKPAIVHGRNLAALDGLLPAALAGIRCRIHGEHGRDVSDLRGENRKLQWLRRIYQPLVSYYVPLSKDLENYLVTKINVPARKIRQIYNGVDTALFHPASHDRQTLPIDGFSKSDQVIIGTVGRLDPVKDQLNLIEGFARVVGKSPRLRATARLVIVGDGAMRKQIEMRIRSLDIADITWLAGARDDIADMLRCMDVFVLPSLAEGISNTILEAMSCGLPVVATDVGGNRELLSDGDTGQLIPSADPVAMAKAIEAYLDDPAMRLKHGRAGRKRIEQEFSLDGMVQRYLDLYDMALRTKLGAGQEYGVVD